MDIAAQQMMGKKNIWRGVRMCRNMVARAERSMPWVRANWGRWGAPWPRCSSMMGAAVLTDSSWWGFFSMMSSSVEAGVGEMSSGVEEVIGLVKRVSGKRRTRQMKLRVEAMAVECVS
jgi:hypothetical protein